MRRSTNYYPVLKEGDVVDIYWDHQTEDPKSFLGKAYLKKWIPRSSDGLSYVLEDNAPYAEQIGYMSECWEVEFLELSLTKLGKHYVSDPNKYRAFKRYKILLASSELPEEESLLDKIYGPKKQKRESKKRPGRKTIYKNNFSNLEEKPDNFIKINGREIY
jgi:hypothetical protein